MNLKSIKIQKEKQQSNAIEERIKCIKLFSSKKIKNMKKKITITKCNAIIKESFTNSK